MSERISERLRFERDLTAWQKCASCGVTIAVGTIPEGGQFSDGCLSCPWCGERVMGVPRPVPLPVVSGARDAALLDALLGVVEAVAHESSLRDENLDHVAGHLTYLAILREYRALSPATRETLARLAGEREHTGEGKEGTR